MCASLHFESTLPYRPGKRVPNWPLRSGRGRFGTLLQLLVCWVFGRTAVGQHGAKTVRLQYGPEVRRPRRWSSRPSSSGSRPGSPSVSEATLVQSDLDSVRRSKEIASGSSRTGNEQVLRIEQPTASRRRRPAGRTPPAVFFLEAPGASARHPPLAPTAATPRLHSKYQSPGTHLGKTV